MIMLAVIFIGSAAYAQTVSEAEVPSVVKTKFASLYPTVKVEKWKMDKGNYKAMFDENKEEMCVVIDAKGEVIKTKTSIKTSELPSSAKGYIEKTYPGKTITEACKMTDETGKVTYKAEVGETHVMFDANGAFLKETKEMHKKKMK